MNRSSLGKRSIRRHANTREDSNRIPGRLDACWPGSNDDAHDCVLESAVGTSAQAAQLRVYVGTYTGGGSEGIYVADFDDESGAVSNLRLAAKVTNPSFLSVHPNKKFLYAVGEVGEFNGEKTGMVTAFAINPDGTLNKLNQQSSGGTGPCHLSVDPTGQAVLVANYGGGSVASIALEGTASSAHSSARFNMKVPARIPIVKRNRTLIAS